MPDYEGVELAYYNSLKVALEDGSIDNKEFKHLDELRDQLSISMETHNKMESEIRVESTTKKEKDTKSSLGIKDSVVSKSNITNISGDSIVQKVSGDVENNAKLMIDIIERGDLEKAISVWEKAKEIDIDKTKKFFQGEKYGKKIADAYLDLAERLLPQALETIEQMWPHQGTPLAGEIGSHADEIYAQIQICYANSEVFYPDEWDLGDPDNIKTTYFRTHLVAATSIFEFHKDLLSGSDFQSIMGKARAATNRTLQLDPDNKQAKQLLAKIENEKPKSNNCFIATAAYGTPFAEEIDVLRNWRDDFLSESFLGQKFIKMYYSLSPPVANNINTSDTKKKIVRITLNPIVKILKGNYSK